MKKTIALLLAALMLTGCASNTVADATPSETGSAENLTETIAAQNLVSPDMSGVEYVSRFDSETVILLSDDGITVNGGEETETVFTSHDIIYYEDRDTYDSGNPYGEGTDADKHAAEEAAAHTVVNITAPGAYRISGKLSAGQIRVDLGDDAYEDPEAVAELILEDADITCTVAPAILFLNTYECDGMWSTDTAKPDVDTSAAGANLVLEGENTVNGAYVARIYKDKEGEKKLWKQDGAIYSYMSMNVFGPGSLTLTAENEGLDTELHLTINGGDITIYSGNDGINTNEDGVSVTTINGGLLWILAGLGEEGDGIDSNGYLVINGGVVSAHANPAADAGLDSDMGSYINGGTVIALGSTMDWAESDSDQVTMNLQFARNQQADSIVVTSEDGTVVFAYTPDQQEAYGRQFMGAVISSPNFTLGETYYVYVGGTVTGNALSGGIVDVTTVTGYTGGTQLAYTGTDVTMGGGMAMGGHRPGGQMSGGFNGEMPEGFDGEMPEGFSGEMPEGFTPGEKQADFAMPDGEMPTLPEGETMPDMDGFGRGQGGERPEGSGEALPDGEIPSMPEGDDIPQGEMPEGGFGGRGQMGGQSGETSTAFYMQDKVNAFSGVSAVTE